MKDFEVVQRITRKQTKTGNEIIQANLGLLPDKIWKSRMRKYPTDLLRVIRKSLLDKVPDLAEKFNPTSLYFAYRARNGKGRVKIRVQKKFLIIDLCISRNFTRELEQAGFEVKHQNNFQGKAGWLTGWRIPQSTQNHEPIVKWLCKALDKDCKLGKKPAGNMEYLDMKKYKTIKELVIETYMAEGKIPSYRKLTSLVKQFFPHSKWKETHYAWYKSQIKRGNISVSDDDTEPDFNDEEILNETDIEDSLEASISVERDLQDYLEQRLTELEPGLKLHDGGVEYETDAGKIDILAVDEEGALVVIEIKSGKAKDNALGQILGYIGCLYSSRPDDKNIRGILVASGFDQRVIYAAKKLTNIKLITYKLSFIFNEIQNDVE